MENVVKPKCRELQCAELLSRFLLEMVGNFSHRGAAGSVTAQVQSTRTVHVPWVDDDGVWHLGKVTGPLAEKIIVAGSAQPADAR